MVSSSIQLCKLNLAPMIEGTRECMIDPVSASFCPLDVRIPVNSGTPMFQICEEFKTIQHVSLS
jgi:hypothetical protein